MKDSQLMITDQKVQLTSTSNEIWHANPVNRVWFNIFIFSIIINTLEFDDTVTDRVGCIVFNLESRNLKKFTGLIRRLVTLHCIFETIPQGGAKELNFIETTTERENCQDVSIINLKITIKRLLYLDRVAYISNGDSTSDTATIDENQVYVQIISDSICQKTSQIGFSSSYLRSVTWIIKLCHISRVK